MNWNNRHFIVSFALVMIAVTTTHAQSNVLTSQNGLIHFSSDAPLENIEADSKSLKGILNTVDNRFAFSVDIVSFQGFNSPLQREHFNENYMESTKFPKSSFTGKIIENVNYYQNGTFNVRAKGMLEIHGVSKERIIPITLVIANAKYSFSSNFNVLLADHNISVPKIVNQKISQTIEVEVRGEFLK